MLNWNGGRRSCGGGVGAAVGMSAS
jgi:hypothetical protein